MQMDFPIRHASGKMRIFARYLLLLQAKFKNLTFNLETEVNFV